jgi:hypothetical protein
MRKHDKEAKFSFFEDAPKYAIWYKRFSQIENKVNFYYRFNHLFRNFLRKNISFNFLVKVKLPLKSFLTIKKKYLKKRSRRRFLPVKYKKL